jgi:hypothetical protein
MDAAQTSLIVVAQILIISLIGNLVLFLLIRKKQKKQSADDSKNIQKKASLLEYIQSEIQRCQQRLSTIQDERLDDSSSAIRHRLSLLEKEKQLLQHLQGDSSDNYWKAVRDKYMRTGKASSDPTSTNPSQTDSDYQKMKNTLNLYIMRNKNLEKYKKLFLDNQYYLSVKNEAFEKVSQHLFNSITVHTQEDIQDLISKLESDKVLLQKELDIDDEVFEEIITNMRELLDISSAPQASTKKELDDLMDRFENLEEENDFLVKQIQHLLEQEVEASKNILIRVEELEDQIKTKDKEIEELKSN